MLSWLTWTAADVQPATGSDSRGTDPASTAADLPWHPSGVIKSSTSFGWGKGENVTIAGWQITLCNPLWHAIFLSSKLIHTKLRYTLTFTFCLMWHVGNSSKPVFHTLYAVLWSSDAHLVESCTSRKTHSFFLTASDRRRMLPRSVWNHSCCCWNFLYIFLLCLEYCF